MLDVLLYVKPKVVSHMLMTDVFSSRQQINMTELCIFFLSVRNTICVFFFVCFYILCKSHQITFILNVTKLLKLFSEGVGRL